MFNPVSEPSFRLDVAGLHDVFEVLAFTGSEAISAPFVFDIQLLIADRMLDLASLLYRSAALHFGPVGSCVHGQLQEIVQRDHGGGVRLCQARLGPRLACLAQRVSQRIFSGRTVPEILGQVLKEHGIVGKARRFELSGEYPPRDFCTQYRESDLQFCQRLCAEERIHYRFEHHANLHCLVFSDAPRDFPVGEFAMFRTEGGAPAVRQFEHQRSDQSAVQLAQCRTDLPTLRSGQLMPLAGHPVTQCNHRWLLTSVDHHGSQDMAAPYHNQVRALHWATPFEPPCPAAKPRMHSLHRAWVVEVDEPTPDPERPVPVQFDWIYQGEGAVSSHCWLALDPQLQSSTGATLHEGTELVVSFIEGDPDQPLITGVLHVPQATEELDACVPPLDAVSEKVLQQWLHGGEPLMLLCLLPGGGSFNHCAQVLCSCRAATWLGQSGSL
ncbi:MULTISPECIES: type VI secretion system Vgr family protein [unclassified Pseudomonas]|jgi:type VI secretion system secreted protein VgrG|uniref:type VI secretion system Vgr family protein n=1 Tax=unclassified Pseudomonas TaxID=196821 RepID=UPI00069F5C3B|nr:MULTISPECIES: contractile injection system protein, VgrG/Pvc8 family [unclassified Pseudomonas]WPN47795.1 contractile injection system protein, VgrG/Pvc8 family [Pseudomonas sp. P8_241]